MDALAPQKAMRLLKLTLNGRVREDAVADLKFS
jgi:hypothetical protein